MFQGNLYFSVLFIVFVLSAAIQLFYYLWFYLALSLYRNQGASEEKKPVSVIICARNESENLKEFLPSVLEQEYPDYEVIVVNDCSEDNSYDVLGTYLLKYPHLKVSNVNKDPKFTHNKKFAQFIGIKAAKNEILLFTDADCHPETPKWIEGIAANFKGNICFVLGYGGYSRKKGLLNKYIRFDSLTIAMQYLGMALRGIPYMGVGRNLAYLRSVFFDNKGFGSHTHIISGDDDLFVNSNSVKGNTAVAFSSETHTRSVPAETLKEWIRQKKRHMTTAPYYKLRDKLLLITEPLTRILFYTTFIILISFLFFWPFILVIFSLRMITQIVVLSLSQNRLNEPGLLGYSVIFDIFSPLINGALLISNTLRRPGKSQWK